MQNLPLKWPINITVIIFIGYDQAMHTEFGT